jgi:hypothetical protein
MKTNPKNTEEKNIKINYPAAFGRWVEELGDENPDAMPRRVTKKFHGMEITGWAGRVNVEDVEGYVENKRLKFYLNRWRSTQAKPDANPTTQQMYEMMLEADADEQKEEKKIFCLDRLARSILRNGVQEEITVFLDTKGHLWLWDGNRRFFATYHIMHDDAFKPFRDNLQWIPCFLIEPSGDKRIDEKRKHSILTEMNFVKKDAISWPNYIKAEEIWEQFNIRIQHDPADPVLARQVKAGLASEYGLFSRGKPAPGQVDRWIRMVNLAREFKDYQQEERQRDENAIDLHVSDYFEYFDELSKKDLRELLSKDPDKRDEVFDWLWDKKLPSFQAVRKIPLIYDDPVALEHMRSGGPETAFESASNVLAANDPKLVKDKRAAAAKIDQFAKWLSTFKPEDFQQLDADSLNHLKDILGVVTKMLEGLLTIEPEQTADAPAKS